MRVRGESEYLRHISHCPGHVAIHLMVIAALQIRSLYFTALLDRHSLAEA